jgi:plasmid stability protein
MNGKQSVATKKPKVAGYVPDTVKKALKNRAEKSGRSESSELEDILINTLDPSTVLIKMKESSMKTLEQWADSEMRPLEVQIKWLLEKAITEYLEHKSQ